MNKTYMDEIEEVIHEKAVELSDDRVSIEYIENKIRECVFDWVGDGEVDMSLEEFLNKVVR